MLGKRTTRVYSCKTAEPQEKIQKKDVLPEPHSSQTTEQSKCPSPSITACTTQQEEIKSQEPNYSKKSEYNDKYSKRVLLQDMLGLLVEEFNCHHQADLDSDQQVAIFVRDQEQKTIRNFIEDNRKSKKAALMYLCGHPGTGKTSTLNLVLAKMKNEIQTDLLKPIEVFMYNAMTFADMKAFCMQLIEDVHRRLTDQEMKDKVNRQKVDDDKISQQIAHKLKNYKANTHKVLVIDEIDSFQSNEKSFTILIKSLIKANCNTSIIGIANSVDLPFKKKDSGLSFRQIQMLFQPYSKEQIINIIEEKFFKKFSELPLRLKDIKEDFFDVLDDKSLELIARKVAKMNGDIRVAFDLIKTCFNKLHYEVKYIQKENQISAKLTIDLIMKVFEEKYGSKVKEILKALPRQNLVVLESVVNLFEYLGEEKQLQFVQLFDEIDKECKARCLQKFDLKQILNCIEELEYYSLIEVEKSKKEVKNSKFSLKVELAELIKELDLLSNPEKANEVKQVKEQDQQVHLVDLEEDYKIV